MRPGVPLLLLGLSLTLTGCYEIDVRLEADGSGVARIAMDTPVGDTGAPLDEGALRGLFTAPGVKVIGVRHLDVLDRRRILVEIWFRRLEDLPGARAFEGLSVKAGREGDRLLVRASFQDPKPEELRRLELQGRPVRVGIRFPGVVREANGKFVPSGRTVLWESSTDALASGPLAMTAASGVELAPAGPGRATLLTFGLCAILFTGAACHALRRNHGPHAFLIVGGLCTLAFEVILTRLFSAVLWYHFAFMAISIALLGQGAGASLITALGPRPPGRARPGLGRPMLLCALSILAVVVLVTRYTRFAGDSSLGFVLLFLAASLPFFFFGAGVARVFEDPTHDAGRLYFANLLGASAGTVLAIPLITLLGAETALLAVALMAAAAATALSRGAGRLPSLVASMVLLGLLFSNRPDGPLLLRTGKGGHPKQIDLGLWNSFSYVTVGREFGSSWAVSKSYRGGRAPSLGLEIDLNAFTPIVRWRGDTREVAEVLEDVTAIVHRVKRGGDVLVIGPGGGKDVLAAVALGARHVTAVEINPLIVSLVRDRFAFFTGGLYRDPRVTLVVENGRAFVDESPERFDVIQASLVDTWAASASGAFALTENHLYTDEAFVSYLGRLKPGGLLSVSRWHHQPPRESLRLLSLAVSALRASGAAEPHRHVAVVFAGNIATFLIAHEPLEGPAREAIAREATAMGFDHAFGGDPAPGAGDPLRRALSNGMEAVASEVAWDTSPPRDDKPFFFHTVRARDYLTIPWRAFTGDLAHIEEINAQAVWVVLRLLWISVAAAAALILGPLFLARRRLGRLHFGAPLLYFSCLGLAFVFIVSGHIGRLSVRFGNPTLAFVTLTFTTLIGASVGAALSARLVRRPIALVAVPAGLLVFIFALGLPSLRSPWLLGSLMALQGCLLGIPFPRGLHAIRGSAVVPWAFAANGALSVVAGGASMVLALLGGFRALLCCGVALYLLAAGTYPILARNE